LTSPRIPDYLLDFTQETRITSLTSPRIPDHLLDFTQETRITSLTSPRIPDYLLDFTQGSLHRKRLMEGYGLNKWIQALHVPHNV
jgi:hypothetical protein